jgi:hypothetical protein
MSRVGHQTVMAMLLIAARHCVAQLNGRMKQCRSTVTVPARRTVTTGLVEPCVTVPHPAAPTCTA